MAEQFSLYYILWFLQEVNHKILNIFYFRPQYIVFSLFSFFQHPAQKFLIFVFF